MVKQKRKITSRKAPQKTVLPAYNEFLQSESDSREDTPRSSGTESNLSDSFDQNDNDESSSGQSNATSSSGGFWRIPIRSRRRFTLDETEALEQAYKQSKRPSQEVKQRFARNFDTNVPRIQIWFQNRRAKEKKMSDSSTNQRASTADQDSDSNDIPASETLDHDTSTTSTDTSSTRRRKTPRKTDSSPPVENPSTGKQKKKKQKQNQPAGPIPQQFLPSGSYHFPYPNYEHQLQAIDHSSTSNTQMSNENLTYGPVYPPRRVYLHDSDWHSSRFFLPPFPQQFQRPLPNERPMKYVDPKKMVRPESSAMAPDNISGDKPLSKKGKQRQKSTDTSIKTKADSGGYYDNHEDSPEIKSEQGDLQFFVNPKQGKIMKSEEGLS